jgi:surface antigen
MAPDNTFPNSYARGQCTWYVAGRRQIPGGWGNAKTWYYHAIASSWKVGTVPAIAAVAWTPAGTFGHVALVEQISADSTSVYISEMNYRAVGQKTYRWVPASSFKYIY